MVEAALCDVLEGNYGTGAHPNTIFGAAISICVDWGTPAYFCGDRQTTQHFVEAYLKRCARVINKYDHG